MTKLNTHIFFCLLADPIDILKLLYIQNEINTKNNCARDLATVRFIVRS